MKSWTRIATVMIIVGAVAFLLIGGITRNAVDTEGVAICERAMPNTEILAFEFSPYPLGVQCLFDDGYNNVDLATIPAALALIVVAAGVILRVHSASASAR